MIQAVDEDFTIMSQELKKNYPLPPSTPDQASDGRIKEMKAIVIQAGHKALVDDLDKLCVKTQRDLWKQGVSDPGLGTKSKKKVVLIANFQPVSNCYCYRRKDIEEEEI